MRENTLSNSSSGETAFGVVCTFPSPPLVEMLGYLGFDWILLDNEHGSTARIPRTRSKQNEAWRAHQR